MGYRSGFQQYSARVRRDLLRDSVVGPSAFAWSFFAASSYSSTRPKVTFSDTKDF